MGLVPLEYAQKEFAHLTVPSAFAQKDADSTLQSLLDEMSFGAVARE